MFASAVLLTSDSTCLITGRALSPVKWLVVDWLGTLCVGAYVSLLIVFNVIELETVSFTLS